MQISRRFNIRLDYIFSNKKLLERLELVFVESVVLCRIINIQIGSIQPIVTPLYLEYPIRGKLEIQVFSRIYIESLDLQSSRGRGTILLPLIIFIAAFGLYRNLYRSLIGVYFIIVVLSTRKRDRRANIRLYSSNFADIVEAIKLLTILSRGIKVYILGTGKILLVAFTLTFLSNVPQQQKNSSIKIQRANLSYRIYYIYANFRGVLDYNIFLEGQFYYTILEIRYDIDSMPTKAAYKVYSVKQGINLDPATIALIKISLSLDIGEL